MLELRHQCQSRHSDKPLPGDYAGRRANADPVEHIKKRYGEQIRRGEFGPGHLNVTDKSLYSALQAKLSQMEGTPTMREFFDTLKDPEKVGKTPFQIRLQACAIVLGTDQKSAAKFFGGLRSDRAR